MLKWVPTKVNSSKEINAKANNGAKPKKVTFCETVFEIPDNHDKLKFLFELGYRKGIRLINKDEAQVVNLSDEGVATKTTLKP